jgi:hypothetical protein
MSTNFYFQSGIPMGRRSESLLHEDLIIECLKIYGFDAYYLPRTLVNRDFILNEDVLNKFRNAYAIEVYLDTINGFGGSDLLAKFGVEFQDTATFTVSRRRWEELIGRKGTTILSARPAEGDILFFPLTKSFFEIKYVEAKDPFFQIGKLYVYKLQCEIFQFSSETFETLITEIDEIPAAEQHDILTYQLALESAGSLILEEDEKSSLILEEYNLSEIDGVAENENFRAEINDTLDFSESNPFGEVYNP